MGPMLAALLKLQSIENNMAHVRRRLRSKQNAENAVRTKIDQLTAQQQDLHEQNMRQQSDVDQRELDRASREEDIARLRVALRTARTNKEYSAILTQINTHKADNSKLEDDTLKLMEAVEEVKGESDRVAMLIENEQKHLDQVTEANSSEVTKLDAMLADLQDKRDQAAAAVAPEAMAAFDRIAGAKDGEAMAPVEVTDAKRGEYICGGCYMSLTAEHYSALLSRDEIRHCDSCGRILYVEAE